MSRQFRTVGRSRQVEDDTTVSLTPSVMKALRMSVMASHPGHRFERPVSRVTSDTVPLGRSLTSELRAAARPHRPLATVRRPAEPSGFSQHRAAAHTAADTVPLHRSLTSELRTGTTPVPAPRRTNHATDTVPVARDLVTEMRR